MVIPLRDTPDLDLLRKTAEGDSDAFGTLYDRYSSPVYNYILRLVHEPGPAEELLQEVFLAVWTGAQRFNARASVKTWVFRIAHHQAVSWLRRNHKHNALQPIPDATPDDDPTPEERSIASWQVEQVTLALNRLSDVHRAVIELTYVHNFSQKEVARIMGCPVGTVKSRLNHALKHLNALLKSGLF